MQYLEDAQQGRVPLQRNVDSESGASKEDPVSRDTAYYTIRALLPSEHSFGSDAATAAIGLTSAALAARAEAEGWVGMRVDLWDEGSEDGLLVKVQYWWRLEVVGEEGDVGEEQDGKVWKQCLHDIMYLGLRDGTEGREGVEILR